MFTARLLLLMSILSMLMKLTFHAVSACSLSCCMLASLQMQLLLRPRVSARSKAGGHTVHQQPPLGGEQSSLQQLLPSAAA
jgi:hypothetical protein